MRFPGWALGLLLTSLLGATTVAAEVSPCCAVSPEDGPTETLGKACNEIGENNGLPGCAELDEGNCIGGGPALNGITDEEMEQFVLGFCVCVNGDCVSDGAEDDTKAATDRECTRDAVWGCHQTLGATHDETP